MANSTSTDTPAGGTNPPAPPVASPHYREAFKRAQPAAMALATSDLIPVNIDIPTAVTTAVGKLPEILAHRDQILAELPKFDVSALDLLETYTLATGHAHAAYLAASAPPEALAKLTENGVELRDTLYSDALALANRGLISGDRVGDFKGAVGYKNLAFDLLGLAALLRQNWERVAGKTALQPSELDQAEVLGEQLVNALGVREQGPAVAAEVTQQRQRTFTLFLKAYDRVRRAISYLRWDEDDVDDIAPSLYAGRNMRRTAPAVPAAPAQPAPGTKPTPPGASGPSPVPVAATPKPAPAVPAVGQGLPGSSPFVG